MLDVVKKVMMIVSLVFVVICFAASLWMALSLPDGNSDILTFSFMAFVFFAAMIWFGWNVYNLFKSDGK